MPIFHSAKGCELYHSQKGDLTFQMKRHPSILKILNVYPDLAQAVPKFSPAMFSK